MVQTNAVSAATSNPTKIPVTPKKISGNNTPKLSRRTRGLDEISPFLHQIQKIVSDECSNHESVETIPWYKTWESWMQHNLLIKTSMNAVTSIIVSRDYENGTRLLSR